jgi:hypothetical protein
VVSDEECPELSADEIGELVARVTGETPSRELVAEVHARLEADPARLAEMVRCLLRGHESVRRFAQAGRPPRAPGTRHPPAVFRRDGEIWTVAFGGVLVRLQDMRGLWYVSRLLGRPGETLSATELVASASSQRGRVLTPERARISVTKAIGSALVRIGAVHPVLGSHLAAAVRRGQRCSYTPDPRRPIRWDT